MLSSFHMTAIVTATAIASMLDPTIMAHIALGEVGGSGIWGDRAHEVQAMVIWVARNQEACPWAPEDYDPRWQFYGWEDVVTERDVERAAAVINSQGPDPTKGALFVLSAADRIKLGFPRGDIVECGVAPFFLHFYEEWPNRRLKPSVSPNPIE